MKSACKTQLSSARNGQITPEVEMVAERESHLTTQEISAEIAAGRAIIPANPLHLEMGLNPVLIGERALTKINANLGTSADASDLSEEQKKLTAALQAGADTVMDLSTGGDLSLLRKQMVSASPVPVGTVPLYSLVQDRSPEDLTVQLFLKELEKQAVQGVDFFTIHSGLLFDHLSLVEKRLGGIVSRGGSLLARWMRCNNQENFLYQYFSEIIALLAEYDVTISLGDALRPGCLADATDAAQLAELEVLGELTEQAQSAGVQVMVEGPGHVPFDQIAQNVRLQQQLCNHAPFYVLGPLVSDIFPGYDHITGAIGATEAARHGAALLCYVTPTEHLCLPDEAAVKEGCAAFKIAAHAADIAREIPGVDSLDHELSRARAALDWKRQLKYCYEPEKIIDLSSADPSSDDQHCSMCGADWCAVKNSSVQKN